MSYAQDDLADLFIQAASSEPGLRMGQGTIVSWNAEDFTNVVEFRGVRLTNLPVLSGTEALSFASGDVVQLIGRNGSYAILGRMVSPTAVNAARVVQFLQTNLAREISAEVFAARVKAAEVTTFENTASATYTDLTTAGPSVTVDVTATGICLVWIGAQGAANGAAGTTARMSPAVSGATTIAASDQNSAIFSHFLTGHSRVVPFFNLNPGTHTITAKYRNVGATDTSFADRHLVAMAF